MQIIENQSLLAYNTFGIAAHARYFTRIQQQDDLAACISYADEKNISRRLVLGGGSNVLFTGDFDGLVIRNELKGIVKTGEDADHIYLKAGAGENWHEFVMYCVQHNYAGIENLSLIPGFVGASPMQNIGAYGVEIKDVFHELEAYHIQDGAVRIFSGEECRFGYRESVFKNIYKNQYVILNVSFRLRKQPEFNTSYGAIRQELEHMGVEQLSIKAISDAVIRIRSSKLPDPRETGNAGSFFKNPAVSTARFNQLQHDFPSIVGFPFGEGQVKLAAGWLIEQCGWKGFRKGDAGCYPKQALVLVNYGNARGKEILQLSEEIILSVQEKFGVSLEREVNLVS